MVEKLTEAQRRALHGLLEEPGRFATVGPTNSTMLALKRRGFAEKYFVDPEGSSWYDARWKITLAGRAAFDPDKKFHAYPVNAHKR